MRTNTEQMREVMLAIAKGDKKAFEQLFRDWYVRLCVYAESIVRDRDLAEDLVQGIFCTLWEKRDRVDVRESVKSYLYRSVYNSALNTIKHEKVKIAFLEFIRKHEKEEDNDIERFFDSEDRNIVLKELNRAIETLPDQCREIFLLSRFAGKKSAEIASELDLSIRTVEAQLYRAMKRLREELSHLRQGLILFLNIFLEQHFRR